MNLSPCLSSSSRGETTSLSPCFGWCIERLSVGWADDEWMSGWSMGVEAEREMVVQGAGWGRWSEDGGGVNGRTSAMEAHRTYPLAPKGVPMKAKDDRHLWN